MKLVTTPASQHQNIEGKPVETSWKAAEMQQIRAFPQHHIISTPFEAYNRCLQIRLFCTCGLLSCTTAPCPWYWFQCMKIQIGLRPRQIKFVGCQYTMCRRLWALQWTLHRQFWYALHLLQVPSLPDLFCLLLQSLKMSQQLTVHISSYILSKSWSNFLKFEWKNIVRRDIIHLRRRWNSGTSLKSYDMFGNHWSTPYCHSERCSC